MLVKCDNCGWTGNIEEGSRVIDIFERVAPGEVMPACDCPKCRALCYLMTAEDEDEDSVPTREQIEALQAEAACAGDDEMFNLCSRALQGSRRASAACRKAIINGRG